ncbi:1-acyl-sn-glycerol-3-phosphate acyltransferase [Thermanaeromonas toyohensis ToBE]|uniref:1-acyl-sn-glycerol-3-phosphate acyltransferase n=1 Tax=Thermanaeromonas toyohensis ToBE TaxID=698762 RepID=A0A1W1VY59_9FIRM|nr:lysophospholipid acyltransferase family protein [Thermanaeromonas toyohensis]SMB98322.1 1-acyl-sn-glycerol-3-phosphate acyltransferase [Thermanaeromonas toyohensis ToBE]
MGDSPALFYRLAKFICYIFFQYICRWEVKGQENFPLEGPAVVVSNHVSLWDPVAVGVAIPRPVRFMAKEELFRIPFLAQLLRALGAFPVRRGRSDRQALKESLEILRSGQVLGMFPEGTRVRTGELGAFHGGAALLSLKTGAPLVPVAVKGTEQIFRRGWFHTFQVLIGNPIYPGSKESYTPLEVEELSQKAREAISKLLKEA